MAVATAQVAIYHLNHCDDQALQRDIPSPTVVIGRVALNKSSLKQILQAVLPSIIQNDLGRWKCLERSSIS